MIDQNILLITASAMFVFVLLLIACIHSVLHWTIKSMLISMSLVVAAMDYHILVNSLGYPVSDDPPSRFKLLGVVVDEPDQRTGSKGEIYIWYQDPKNAEPRNITMPYTKELHKKMGEAKERLRKGENVYMMDASNQDGDAQNGSGKNKKGSGKPGDGRGNGRPSDLQAPLDFVPPPDTIPEKDPS